MVELTQEIVRELLDYDPDTGKLYWRQRGVEWFTSTEKRSAELNCAWWNKRFAGKEAGCEHRNLGYRQIRLYKKSHLSHRLIWLWLFGKWPEEQIDHKNGVRTDNRISNLREVTQSENKRNAKLPSTNTSGSKGVSWNKKNQKWVAQINIDGRKTCLGSFSSLEEASKVWQQKARGLGFTERHIFEKM